MNAIVDKVNLLNNEIELLKPAFEAYIKDKNYPLEERWDTFSVANDALSNHSTYIGDLREFKSFDSEKWIANWAEIYGRGKSISLVTEVELECDNSNEIPEGFEGKDSTDYLMMCPSLHPIMEEILEKNLKTVAIDW